VAGHGEAEDAAHGDGGSQLGVRACKCRKLQLDC
jgi:hypothetical protein